MLSTREAGRSLQWLTWYNKCNREIYSNGLSSGRENRALHWTCPSLDEAFPLIFKGRLFFGGGVKRTHIWFLFFDDILSFFQKYNRCSDMLYPRQKLIFINTLSVIQISFLFFYNHPLPSHMSYFQTQSPLVPTPSSPTQRSQTLHLTLPSLPPTLPNTTLYQWNYIP